MDVNNMSFEEWRKYADEYFGLEEADSSGDEEEQASGNPYGAGRYCYIRSSMDSSCLFLGNEAGFDSEYNLWYEYIGCGYACERDGIALQEADDIDLYHLHKEYPEMICKESHYDFTYGDTRDEVSWASFSLTECEGGRERTFYFDLENISMLEAKEYVSAIEKWHRTGEFNIGPYRGIPSYTAWRTK